MLWIRVLFEGNYCSLQTTLFDVSVNVSVVQKKKIVESRINW